MHLYMQVARINVTFGGTELFSEHEKQLYSASLSCHSPSLRKWQKVLVFVCQFPLIIRLLLQTHTHTHPYTYKHTWPLTGIESSVQGKDLVLASVNLHIFGVVYKGV